MNNNKIAIAVHGGAGPINEKIKANSKRYEEGLKKALYAGYNILEKGGKATEAVEEAVRVLEDDPLFNSGHGSALNSDGKIEMDAAIMDGSNLRSGAVATVTKVRNPISLAACIMNSTDHILITGKAAEEFAAYHNLRFEDEQYFTTPDQQYAFRDQKDRSPDGHNNPIHGTVGAVALDEYGNIAAGTSTGGTAYSLPGRTGASCIIGAGCYADNSTCAVSCTGDGEPIMIHLVAHSIAMYIHLKDFPLKQACEEMIYKKLRQTKNDIGLISVDRNGDFGIIYNSERMHHAWKNNSGEEEIRYK